LQLSLPAKLNHLKKIRVAAVSYLNTKPLLYGIRKSTIINDIELSEDYPSKIAQMLIDDEVDLALIPVAATIKLSEWYIVGNHCIGCEGAVASVGIFSEVPMEQIEVVYLDYQSKTSVNLAQILLREYWKKDVVLIDATGENYRKKITGTTAAVIIGDRALEQRLLSKYMYDLGEAWLKYTGLPFVFAAWISNKKLPNEFVTAFDEANAIGLQHLNGVIAENEFAAFNLEKYYTECISYKLNDQKRRGMELFLTKMQEKFFKLTE
jgi:chorismate dehydratase